MNRILIGSAVALALSSTHLAAGTFHQSGGTAQSGMVHGEQIWLVQGNSGKGHGKDKGPKKVHGKAKGHDDAGKGKGKGKGKPEHAGTPKAKGNGKGAKDRRPFSAAEREEAVGRIVATPAPAGRDMTRILGAAALALATPQLLVADVPDEELIAYRNCPPGLAKKDPPCVPPGLAKKGVTYDEWASYDDDEYDRIWIDRRDTWLGTESGTVPEPELLLLRSDQIARLYDLPPAPDGKRYGLIDGLPVLLDDKDFNALLLVNQLAQVQDLAPATRIAPTAALTQRELIDLYRLPQLGDDENYAVVNGQLVRLNDSNYELLQMLRIARAVL